jgi:2-amino-4-hydroxy-6-hydroxymethyldihydropteridine diphosphokinase
MNRKHRVYISVGSNIGDKRANCQAGIDALTRSGDSLLEKVSTFYRTEPVDFEDQDWFVNAAVRIATGLAPLPLLKELQLIQASIGQGEKTVRFGPRILDLDIIFFNDHIIDSPDLVVPHPRMHKRRFVLQPMCDIDATLIHPVLQENIQDLLDGLDDNDQGVVAY